MNVENWYQETKREEDLIRLKKLCEQEALRLSLNLMEMFKGGVIGRNYHHEIEERWNSHVAYGDIFLDLKSMSLDTFKNLNVDEKYFKIVIEEANKEM